MDDAYHLHYFIINDAYPFTILELNPHIPIRAPDNLI